MYSDTLLKFFRDKKIGHGDKIRVDSHGISIEGELMPSTEAGDPNSIVIKLENGYNIGIDYSKDLKIKKMSEGTKTIKFPKSDTTTKKGLPKVTLLYTGGTIGSKIDYKTGGVHPLIQPGELLYEVPELSGIANIEIKQLFGVWSEDMSYFEWQEIAKEVEKAVNSGSKGVVITMGTDTMHYAASALSFMLQGINAPVAITGAQRSSDRGSSDAFFNLASAVQIAAKSDIAEVGICMHATSSDDKCAFIRGTRARKMHTTRRDAFRSVNDSAIAYVDRKLGIYYGKDYSRIADGSSKKAAAKTKFESKVALVMTYPNSDPGIIDFYMGKGYRGIIIEGTGLGNVPGSKDHAELSWLEGIEKATKSGIVVGMTSQCLYGRVNENVYSRGRVIGGLGVVYCEDMLPETAYIKLGWLLGNYDNKEAKGLLGKNIVGEMKKRTEYEEFPE